MKTFAVTMLATLLLNAASGQTTAALLPPPTRSQSGHFLCYAAPGMRRGLLPDDLAGSANLVELEPWLLVVSCERIKDALWRELEFSGELRGKIYLFLHHAQTADDAIIITPQQFADGWNYRVDLPDMVGRARYVSALTHVLLLEIANRRADTRSAEIPLWLREGLGQELVSSPELGLIPPKSDWNANGTKLASIKIEGYVTNSLTHAHDVLRSNPALTFDELSWPSDADLQGDRGDVFRCSAQLFVSRLTGLDNGRAALRTMVESLPHYYNWQFAFLNAFQKHFGRTLDVEKWWAISAVEFSGRDLVRSWSQLESWQKLDAALRPAVEVRTAANQLPLRENVSLQKIIRDLDVTQQTGTLQLAFLELVMMQPRFATNVVGLADDYRTTLQDYLHERNELGKISEAKNRPKLGPGALVRQTLKKLDELDRKREALRPKPRNISLTNAEPVTKAVP